MSKTMLNRKIKAVNNRYAKGLNDDDQVMAMINQDKKTKGYTFLPTYDKYILVEDSQKLESLVSKYGYWSDQVKQFNEVLFLKGGYKYLTELNQKYTGTKNLS